MTLISRRDRAAAVCEQNNHELGVDFLCRFSDCTPVNGADRSAF